ncbi:MAG: 50S ribosomal protein L15 [Candidatus Moranbacteria bacterium CG23_combo_of_CG06-09_8_20_14_all_39_10]|nr:MAG: 50S ribosomal protein L15 [Candidatus Moranbacteria bacterium CG23_combo_of_CG06-09_8_20_14_all_39_10]
MQINTLKLKATKKKRKTIGRGGKKGTYSGKGNKGQKARSGCKIDPLFEGGRSTLIDHMKKKRGFTTIASPVAVVALADLEAKFKDGDVISPDTLVKAGLIRRAQTIARIKILGGVEIKAKLTISKDILASISSKKAIEKAGGKME